MLAQQPKPPSRFSVRTDVFDQTVNQVADAVERWLNAEQRQQERNEFSDEATGLESALVGMLQEFRESGLASDTVEPFSSLAELLHQHNAAVDELRRSGVSIIAAMTSRLRNEFQSWIAWAPCVCARRAVHNLYLWCDQFDQTVAECRDALARTGDAETLLSASPKDKLPFQWEHDSARVVEELAEFWPCWKAADDWLTRYPELTDDRNSYGKLRDASQAAVSEFSPPWEWGDSARDLLETHSEYVRRRFLKLVRMLLEHDSFPELRPVVSPMTDDSTLHVPIQTPPIGQRWLTASEDRPAEFKFGPLEGSKKELVKCMSRTDQRQIENQNLGGAAILIRMGKRTWQLWFRDEGQFEFRLDRLKSARAH